MEITSSLPDTHVLDTLRIARRWFGRSGNGLQRLAPRLGAYPAVSHRALADAQTTHLVFERMMEPLMGWRTPLVDVLAAQGGPMGLGSASPREPLLPLELEEALDRRKPVMMEYLDGQEQRTRRIIEPLTVRRFKGELVMVAHCHLRAARRMFKLDRIVRFRRMEDMTEQAARGTLETWVAGAPVEMEAETPIRYLERAISTPSSEAGDILGDRGGAGDAGGHSVPAGPVARSAAEAGVAGNTGGGRCHPSSDAGGDRVVGGELGGVAAGADGRVG
jgi:hypothetical protein